MPPPSSKLATHLSTPDERSLEWMIQEFSFDPSRQNHQETIFTIGNGYLCTRGALEEGYSGERRATLIHGVFDEAPWVHRELVNAPDWLPISIWLCGERFSLERGQVLEFARILDLRNAVLERRVVWRSPQGRTAEIFFQRFASLADPHLLGVRVEITPLDFSGAVEMRAAINGNAHTLGRAHWQWVGQETGENTAWLQTRTAKSGIEAALAMQLSVVEGGEYIAQGWDVDSHPTLVARFPQAAQGERITAEKRLTVFTSRDLPDPRPAAWERLEETAQKDWPTLLAENTAAWAKEWEVADVIIEGDTEAQSAIRFGIYQLLIAAPRNDDRVSIGARTLSGYGYHGHVFWDTEIFMLPFFTYTRPEVARNLLAYRFWQLPASRMRAKREGRAGARYPWESADTGEEITPSRVPDALNPNKLRRIWTGDLELHISADIAYAIWQYWKMSGDHQFTVERGAEIILETAKFWADRAEWNEKEGHYEYREVMGPDEYHDRVDNNAFTNYMARWHLQKALELVAWLRKFDPAAAASLLKRLDLGGKRLTWLRDVAAKIYCPFDPQTGLIEQFSKYFQQRDLDLKTYEQRLKSMKYVLGMRAVRKTQVIKQPDVLMLLYLLADHFDHRTLKANYEYYAPRTDLSYGSSLAPAIQAIMASRIGDSVTAYENFMRAALIDLGDSRGNSVDGIHGANAGGLWQAVVFGFAGLKVNESGWTISPNLPKHWKRLAFKFRHRGQLVTVDIPSPQDRNSGDAIRAFIFDLDGVLTNTAEYHYRAWKRLADEEGVPFTREENEALRGVPRRRSLELLLKGRRVSAAKAEELMARKNAYYREMVRAISPRDVLPGARELLSEIRAAGYKIAVASASKNAQEVMDRLKLWQYVDALCDGNSVDTAKPAPDLFLCAAQKLGVPPKECVVVEDATAGIAAAKAGGMPTVGLGPKSRVGEADLVLPSLEGARLKDILATLTSKSHLQQN